ncbi:DUF3616 domain-containing protein [Sandaracinus amylolyticus]|uniref:DUF3616 domain-containing protein n=1 Tax=Sandaracinus amylolyticus TaxID=927083 RepID=UPI001F2E8AF0|nr:DUF3616 domain-containing protein [Sandaracinus amylolyticus]UJR87003.1 Hypothetical protein I5071_91040 [Sandaracinus amylolyticus]
MGARTGCLLGRIRLGFGGDAAIAVPENLSAVTREDDGTLWLAADELAALDALRPEGPHAHAYGAHSRVSIASALGLEEDCEIDIEGLHVDGEALWVVGSHSAKRKKPRRKGKEDLARLAQIETDLSRFVLTRIPLEGGSPQLDRCAHLAARDEHAESLIDLLEGDEHLDPFLPREERVPIPGKDNGFDVEGLAIHDDHVLLGLRGPVLRGWAFVIELEMEPQDDGRLAPRRRRKRAYRKHALDLDGLGVRDLMVHGDDVLIVAGPTMTLDGAHRVFRWRRDTGKDDTLVHQGRGALEPLFDLPMQLGRDRAEGACTFDWFDEGDSMLVVYDAPSDLRRLDDDSVLADVFAL